MIKTALFLLQIALAGSALGALSAVVAMVLA
jgi:hypothetical protein